MTDERKPFKFTEDERRALHVRLHAYFMDEITGTDFIDSVEDLLTKRVISDTPSTIRLYKEDIRD